jgi:hypothetical protein
MIGSKRFKYEHVIQQKEAKIDELTLSSNDEKDPKSDELPESCEFLKGKISDYEVILFVFLCCFFIPILNFFSKESFEWSFKERFNV